MLQIEYRKVTKEYSLGEKVLDNVSFKINNGEFVFFVGPSGAGKSTIVKLLIREELPTEGEIFFAGLNHLYENDDKEGLPAEALAKEGMETSLVDVKDEMVNIFDLSHEQLPELRRKIGVVFQDFKVLKSKTVFENIAVALEVVNSEDNVISDVVPNVLSLVSLKEKVDRFPSELSGGELQRLSIARALAHEPDVLVADEPTGMIDPKSTNEVLEILEKINSLGTTVIMATHDYTIVDRMKKRVIRIEDGKLISDKAEGKYNE